MQKFFAIINILLIFAKNMQGFPTADTAPKNVKQQSKDNVDLPRTTTDANVITKTDENLTGSKTKDSNLNEALNTSTTNHPIDAVKTNTTMETYNRIKASYTSARSHELINELAAPKIENIYQLNPESNPLNCPLGYTYYEMDCRLIITEKDCNDTLCHPFSYCDELNECVCEKGYMLETNSLSSNNCVPIPQTGNTSDCPGSCPEGYQCDFNELETESSKVDEKYLAFYFLIGVCCIIFALLGLITIIFKNKLTLKNSCMYSL